MKKTYLPASSKGSSRLKGLPVREIVEIVTYSAKAIEDGGPQITVRVSAPVVARIRLTQTGVQAHGRR